MQNILYTCLAARIGQDVPIVVMYEALYGPADRYTTVRDMQQKMANIIMRTNRHIAPSKIEPGDLKKTYRLTVKSL